MVCSLSTDFFIVNFFKCVRLHDFRMKNKACLFVGVCSGFANSKLETVIMKDVNVLREHFQQGLVSLL